MRLTALILPLAVSCGWRATGGGVGKYREKLAATDIAKQWSLEEIDQGIEALSNTYEQAGLASAQLVKYAIAKAAVTIHSNEYYVTCGNPHFLLSGYFQAPSTIWVMYDPQYSCLPATSLLHEFTHAALCTLINDCDSAHAHAEYWNALKHAEAVWRDDACSPFIPVPPVPAPLQETLLH